MSGLGEFLKKERETQGYSIADVEDKTKIQARYLRAIEEENYTFIPAEVYLRGFVRSYARFLHVEKSDFVTDFLNQSTPEKELELPEYAKDNPENKKDGRKIIPAIIVAVLAFAILWGAQSVFNQSRQNQDSADKPKPNQEELLPESTEKEPPVAEITEEKKLTLRIEISDSSRNNKCWIRIDVDGVMIAEETLRAGDAREYTGNDSIRIRLGNPAVSRLILSGKELDITKGRLEVLDTTFTFADLEE